MLGPFYHYNNYFRFAALHSIILFPQYPNAAERQRVQWYAVKLIQLHSTVDPTCFKYQEPTGKVFIYITVDYETVS